MFDLPVINRDLTGPIPGAVLHRSARGGKVVLAHARCAPSGGWVLHTPTAVYNRSRDGHFWNHCHVCDGPLCRVD